MIEKIMRLAELIAASNLISLGDNLKDELQIIINYLKIMNIIEVNDKKGFHFIGEDAEKHSFNNF
jgi:hypothetical protein